MKIVWCLLTVVGGVLIVGCGERSTDGREGFGRATESSGVATNLRTFAVRGVVTEVQAADWVVRIRHEAIPGYMAAMTMPFDVKDTNELRGLGPGDVVMFRLLVTEEEGWIDQLQKVGFEASFRPKEREPVRQVRLVEPLSVGDVLPDYTLTNELGQVIHLDAFRGRALGLTFIFTRCPYPTFCPRQTQLFAEAARRLAAQPGGPTNWHLLAVSFDPDHDTPAVLQEYGRRYAYDPARWSFATGAMVEIDALTEQFGVMFGRDGESFSHNLRTVIIDARGRVHRVTSGNTWAVDEFVEGMVAAAGEGPDR